MSYSDYELAEMKWGSYGDLGLDPLEIKSLPELTTEHLQNILLIEMWHISDDYVEAIRQILASRNANTLPNITLLMSVCNHRKHMKQVNINKSLLN
jgi:hypothetical protein